MSQRSSTTHVSHRSTTSHYSMASSRRSTSSRTTIDLGPPLTKEREKMDSLRRKLERLQQKNARDYPPDSQGSLYGSGRSHRGHGSETPAPVVKSVLLEDFASQDIRRGSSSMSQQSDRLYHSTKSHHRDIHGSRHKNDIGLPPASSTSRIGSSSSQNRHTSTRQTYSESRDVTQPDLHSQASPQRKSSHTPSRHEQTRNNPKPSSSYTSATRSHTPSTSGRQDDKRVPVIQNEQPTKRRAPPPSLPAALPQEPSSSSNNMIIPVATSSNTPPRSAGILRTVSSYSEFPKPPSSGRSVRFDDESDKESSQPAVPTQEVKQDLKSPSRRPKSSKIEAPNLSPQAPVRQPPPPPPVVAPPKTALSVQVAPSTAATTPRPASIGASSNHDKHKNLAPGKSGRKRVPLGPSPNHLKYLVNFPAPNQAPDSSAPSTTSTTSTTSPVVAAAIALTTPSGPISSAKLPKTGTISKIISLRNSFRSSTVPNSTSSSTLGASGSRQNPLTLELLEEEMYTVEWTEGEFGYALERVYLEDGRKFFRCVFNTRRATCPSFDKVKKGDLLVQVGDEMISDMELETNQKLTKFFRDVKLKLPIALKFQRVQEVDL